MSDFGTESAASSPGETRYDVFLSYSHKDREKVGMEYILRIKEDIERSLETIITDRKPQVFLDAEALELGDHWHSRIMECLHQCKAVVCLVSEEYLKSDYCTRERLWWNAKQTHAGRFLDGPYPVYFVKLEEGIFSERREVKEMMAVQTDPLPWFEAREKLQEEFIRERLDSISPAVCKKVRDAELARGSFCSVLPPLNENFVGRVTELRELHELCVNGRFPVLQAAGGVGKTELSVAYAYGFADQYPMGRFLFRMERVTGWDEAFAKALEMDGTDAQGIPKKVSEELDFNDKLLEKKDPSELHRAAAKALLERTAKGKLLILLDNLDEDTTLLKKMRDFLCGNPLPENIHILATTRGTFRFSERERFYSYELRNLKEDEAFEMLCLTGNGQYPFDRQPPSGENKEYQAAHEVIRFLDGHAWSMEIVSAFMADNYDPEGFNFAMELESLRKNFILSSESGVTYRAGENAATPAELLRPTLEKLEKLELGAETLELAVFAACFDPDEIPLYLLREYWDRNFPNVTCSKGIPFIYAVNLLAKYHLFRKEGETCRIHRLVQGVFLSRKEKYLPRIIETLPQCSFIPEKYWVTLLMQSPELVHACPQDGTLGVNNWIKLLFYPAVAEKCPWQSFSGGDLTRIIAAHPRFAEKCDWSKLDGGDWATLLEEQPRFADHCDWSKMSGDDWAMLLSEQPQFENKCDWSKLFGKSRYSRNLWATLLSSQPQFADKCDWSKLGGEDVAEILARSPQLAEKCDWSKLDGSAWASLLGERPQFTDHCDWSKLDGRDLRHLLEKQPQFADHCDWSKLDGSAWASLLGERPQFTDHCDWSKLDGRDLRHLLEKQPQFADHCDWSKLDGSDWADLLGKQPQFADKCDWSSLQTGDQWFRLLAFQPQFADKCNAWDMLDEWEWVNLLSKQPQFADKCDWNSLNIEWARLLEQYPQFADKCNLEKLNGRNWVELLKIHPEWYSKINFSQLKAGGLSDLLCGFPQLVKYCDLGRLDGGNWVNLLIKQPQFAEKCDWGKLGGNSNRYGQSDWSNLLSWQPQFADKCDFGKLDGGSWAYLLGSQPQFAEKCDWSKLDGSAWLNLLKYQPQFADKCDLSRLSEEERQSLLEKFPDLFGK